MSWTELVYPTPGSGQWHALLTPVQLSCKHYRPGPWLEVVRPCYAFTSFAYGFSKICILRFDQQGESRAMGHDCKVAWKGHLEITAFHLLFTDVGFCATAPQEPSASPTLTQSQWTQNGVPGAQTFKWSTRGTNLLLRALLLPPPLQEIQMDETTLGHFWGLSFSWFSYKKNKRKSINTIINQKTQQH